MIAWLIEGESANLKTKSLLVLSFSAKWASKSSISCLLKSLEEVAEYIHSKKIGVRVGGSNWIILPTVSRRGVVKRSCTMASYFPNVAGKGGAEIIEML